MVKKLEYSTEIKKEPPTTIDFVSSSLKYAFDTQKMVEKF